MTQSQLNQSGFIFLASELSIEPITYREYLNEYGQDLTTTPNGVADRCHVREVEVEDTVYNEQTEEDEVFVRTEWQIWSWGVNGNHPRYSGTSFDSEEDAELYYYERSEWYISEKNWDAPQWHSTHDEAITDFANTLEKSEGVVRRYLKLSAITARKAAEHRAEMTRQNDERKARLAIAVPAEANRITIDEEFVKAIATITGNNNKKNPLYISATKALLARNGIEKIQSDFWQVMRILITKAKNFTTAN